MPANLNPAKPVVSKGLFDAKSAGQSYDQWNASGGSTPFASIAPSQVNDNMMDKVTAYSSKDSPLMKAARTEGLKIANRRGLLNSTMAADASQDAALRQVVPIASQDSSQDFQRNQAARNFEYTMAGQDDAQGHEVDMFGRTAGLERELQTQRLTSDQRLQTERILAEKDMQLKSLNSDATLQALRLKHDLTTQERAILADKEAQIRGITAERSNLERTILADTENQQRDIAFRGDLFNRDATLRRDLQSNEFNFDQGQRTLDRALQEKLAKWNLDANDRNSAAQLLTNMENLYQNTYASLLNNTAMDAATRTQFMTSIKNLRDKQINFVEQMYDIDLTW
jgi:hypothetical protein